MAFNQGKPNGELAWDYLQKAAEQNQKEAIREIGAVYEKGGIYLGENSFHKLFEPDVERALEYYT